MGKLSTFLHSLASPVVPSEEDAKAFVGPKKTPTQTAPPEPITMSTATTLNAPTTTATTTKQTWLQKAGHWLEKALSIGVEAAQVAEPIVDMAIPSVASLYNSSVGYFVQSEAAFGTAPGQGTAKLASAVPAITANLKAWADENGYQVVDADVAKWASAFADTLNLLPVVKKTS